MRYPSHGTYILSVGLAMFSMFFGAGNIVFPLLTGMSAQGHIGAALCGLCLTAVGVPFLGLYAMTLFDGEYRGFFNRIGPKAGFGVIAILLGLIGPFGALPRCIALSHSTFTAFIPSISALSFSLLAVALIYFLSVKKSKMIEILGIWLTPILLLSLLMIVLKGIVFQDEVHNVAAATTDAFVSGLTSGYHTMDLISAFFFCHFVVNALKKISLSHGRIDHKLLAKNTLRASAIGSGLLALTYSGLAYVAYCHSNMVLGVSPDKVLGILSYHVLGQWGGVVTCVVVVLACLTTAIALAAVFAEFIHKDIPYVKVSYRTSLAITLIISFFVSIIEFQGIFDMLAPIVQAMYPSLIVLTFLNVAAKKWDISLTATANLAIVLATALASIVM